MTFDIEGARTAGYSTAEIVDHLAKSAGFDVPGARAAGYSDDEILQHLSPVRAPRGAFGRAYDIATDPEGGLLPAAGSLVEAALPTKGSRTTDVALDLGVKGALGLGSTATGLLGFPLALAERAALYLSGHQDEPAAQEAVKGLGSALLSVPYKAAGGAVGEHYSENRKVAEQNVQKAKGIWNTFVAGVSNPSVPLGGFLQSVPGMRVAAGVGASTVERLLPAIKEKAGQIALEQGAAAAKKFTLVEVAKAAVAGASATEGVMTAGQILAQGGEAGRPVESTVLPAAVGGAVTALIGRVSGRVGAKLGLGDVEAGLAARMAGAPEAVQAVGGAIARPVKSGAKETLEEFGQSYNEAVAANLALGKPALEGAGEQATMGALSGTIGGAAYGLTGKSPRRQAAEDRLATADNGSDMAAAATELAGTLPEIDAERRRYVPTISQDAQAAAKTVAEIQQPVVTAPRPEFEDLTPMTRLQAQQRLVVLRDQATDSGVDYAVVPHPASPKAFAIERAPLPTFEVGAKPAPEVTGPPEPSLADRPTAPPAGQVVGALKTEGFLRDAAQKATLQAATARLAPEDMTLIERAAAAPFSLSLEERNRLRTLNAGVKLSPARGQAVLEARAKAAGGAAVVVDPATLLPAAEIKRSATGLQTLSREVHGLVEQIGRVFKKNIVLFSSEALTEDGFIHTSDPDTIYLNVNASRPHLVLLGHEITHQMKQQLGHAYTAFEQVVRAGVTEETLAQHKKDYGENANIEELSGDLLGNRFQETGFWSDVFAQIDKNLGPKAAAGVVQRLGALLDKAVRSARRAVFNATGFGADEMISNLDAVRAAAKTALAQYAVNRREAMGEQPRQVDGKYDSFKASQQRENNASGESAASMEAQSRLRDETAKGRDRVLVDRDGTVVPLVTADRVDQRARAGQVILQRGIGRDEWTVLDAGPGANKGRAVDAAQRWAREQVKASSKRALPEVAEEDRAALTQAAANLTPAERSKLRIDVATRMVALIRQLPSANEIAAVAFAGRAKRGWYAESARAIVNVFGLDAPRFAGLLAALSPQISIEKNLTNALNAWKNWLAAGRPTDPFEIRRVLGRSVMGTKGEGSVLGAWVNNSVRALAGQGPIILSGPKVNSFMENLLGNVEEVANDVWVSNFALMDQMLFSGRLRLSGDPGKSPGYLAMNAQIRAAARELTKRTGLVWTPAEVQETVWSWSKALYESQKGGLTASDILYNEELTDDLIRATPGFRTLFPAAENARILRTAGYAEQIARLADEEPGTGITSTAEQTEPFDSETQARHEHRAAARLERLKEEGEAAKFKASTRRQPITVTGIHYSKEPRASLSSAFYGTGLKGAERERGAGARIYFYVDQGGGVKPEMGVGSFAHRATLENLYDAGVDPNYLNQDSTDKNDFERRVVEAGYDGYYVPDFTATQGAAVLLGDRVVPVERAGTGALKPTGETVQRATREDTGYRSVLSQLKTDDSLPAGALTPQRWSEALSQRNPEVHRAMTDAGVFKGTEPLYRNELAQAHKTAVRNAPLLNVGLSTREIKGGGELTPESVRTAVENLGVPVLDLVVHSSDTEPTAIVSLGRPLTPSEGSDLSETLSQEAIVQRLADGSGALYGPQAENWGPFNPEFFVMPDGTPASAVKASARRQTETPEFKKWFGDSKAVEMVGGTGSRDAVWAPMRLYHTTRDASFNAFEPGRKTVNSTNFGDYEVERAASFFTPSAKNSNAYGELSDGRTLKGAATMPVYLKTVNPLDLTEGIKEGIAEKLAATGHVSERFVYNIMPHWEMFDDDAGKNVVAAAKAAGYDSIIFNDQNPITHDTFESWAVFDPKQIKSAIGNRGTFNPADPDIRASPRRTQTEPFFSELARQVETISMNAAPAGSWKAWLKGRIEKGVKAAEIEWSGINEWLDMQGAKVTKQQVLDYLSANGVKVTETVLSEDRYQIVKTADEEFDVLDRARPIRGEPRVRFTGTSLEEAEKYLEVMSDETDRFDPKYGQYQLPGGTAYREVLLTLPQSLDGASVRQTSDGKWRIVSPGGSATFGDTREQAVERYAAQQKDLSAFKSIHWDQPNVLAHVRLNDRTDADGKRVLFVEELQSDWHAAAREKRLRRVAALATKLGISKEEADKQVPKDAGFRGAMISQNINWEAVDTLAYFDTRAAAERWIEKNPPPDPGENMEARLVVQRHEATGDYVAQYGVIEEQRSTVAQAPSKAGVPPAPFVTTTDAWVALAIKRVIKMAVDEGYDKVAFINGEQSAERYDLSEQVDSIRVVGRTHARTGEKTRSVTVELKEDGGTSTFGVDANGVIDNVSGTRPILDAKGKPLADVVGKDMADKIMQADLGTLRGGVEFKGEGLKVGGAGMVAFYDKIVPNVLKDVLRKVGGGAMGAVVIPLPKDRASNAFVEAQYPGFKVQLGRSGYLQEDGTRGPKDTAKLFGSAKEAEAALAIADTASQPGFDITPAMREKAAGGMTLFSPRRQIVGDSGRVYSPAQERMFERTGRTVTKPTLPERIAELRKDLGKRLAQGIADQFLPIREVSKQGYTLARLSKGSAGAVEAFLHHGKLKIGADGAYDADTSGGFIERLGVPLHGELEDFMWWVAANRAERLSAEDRENLFTAEDIAAGKSLSEGKTEFDYMARDGRTTRDRSVIYRDALKTFEEFNKNAMDVAEASGLIDGEARKFWEHEFYVPFYRVSEDDRGFVGGNIKNGIVRQRAFKALKGGKEKLNSDLLANTLQNWAHLVDASAKNRAAKATLEAAAALGGAVEAGPDVVRQMARSAGARHNTVWFMDGGKERHFLVEDPALLEAINGLEFAGLRGPLMAVLSSFKHWLTVGVTASPAFKIRNLIRDSVQALAVSPLSLNVASNLREGFKASERGTQTYVSALASGGLIRFGTMLEGSQSARVRQLVRMGVDESTILDSEDKLLHVRNQAEKLFMAYSEIGNRGEEINRAALFKQLTDAGFSRADAALAARDLMDFSMQGAWTSVRFLTQVVPFMNARIQGLYKLGRGAKEDPKRFAVVLGATALASLALLALYHDDDDWKKREDWDRDNYWWFKIGGVAYRIPKPFELGAIATIAERGVELMTDDEMTSKRFLQRVKQLALDQLSMNPVPQAVKPILDIYANKDSFTGRPIETMGMEKLRPDYRFTAATSMPARALGTAGQKAAEMLGADFMSPVQLDHLVRGYLGWLGSFAVGGADMISRPLTGEPTRPTADYYKVASFGFAAELPARNSRYVTQLYEQATELDQAYSTWRALQKQGKGEEAREYLTEHRAEIGQSRRFADVKRREAQINERIRMVERSALTPDEKKAELQRLNETKDRLARTVFRKPG